MDKSIVFTPNDVVTMVLAVSAGIVTLSSAISAIISWVNKAKQPEAKQNDRINKLEVRVNAHDNKFKEYDSFFKNDDERFNIIERETRVLLTSVHALLKHEINEADNEIIEKAEKALDEYLINK